MIIIVETVSYRKNDISFYGVNLHYLLISKRKGTDKSAPNSFIAFYSAAAAEKTISYSELIVGSTVDVTFNLTV